MLHTKQPLGDTAMHLAARRRDSALMKTLIEAGAHVDTQNTEGQTVMHLTCIQGDEGCLRVLFMAKANCSIGDSEQRTPIHLAAERGFTRLVKIFLFVHQGFKPILLKILNYIFNMMPLKVCIVEYIALTI